MVPYSDISPMTQLDRLMYLQGQLCFFCQNTIPTGEASVEHLHATANGGSNSIDNCVACCKTLNAILGCLSIKEKLRAVLNQEGRFKCPSPGLKPVPKPVEAIQVAPPPIQVAATPKKVAAPSKKVVRTAVAKKPAAKAKKTAGVNLVPAIDLLVKQESGRPRTLEALKNYFASRLRNDFSAVELDKVLVQLQSAGYIVVNEGKVAYSLAKPQVEKKKKTENLLFE